MTRLQPLADEDLARALVDLVERLACDYEPALGLARILAAVHTGLQAIDGGVGDVTGPPLPVIELLARQELDAGAGRIPGQGLARPPGDSR